MEMKEYLSKRTSRGFRKTLFVDRSRDGLFRIYARIAGTKHVYKAIKQSFLTEIGAQEFLNLHATTNNLVRSYKLDR
ncbi:MAG: hypothetical protein AB1403_00600 [Candidatus Riflebacteria bacterium]